MESHFAIAEPASATRAAHLAWWGVIVRFLLHGLIVGTWVSRIPAIQSGLKLSNRTLGLCLLGSAVGSVVAAPAIGWLNGRFGTKRMTAWSTIALSLSLVAPAFSFNPALLFAALLFFGACSAGNDISMNSQAVAVEQALHSHSMSRFHAMFSIGGMAGAAAGGFAASHAITPQAHFTVACLLFVVVSFLTAHWLLDDPADHPAARHQRSRFRLQQLSPVLFALIVAGFCIFLAEAAIADWSAVYLKQVLSAGPGLAAASYAVFSVGMAVFRLLGDAITARIGPVATLRGGALIAAAGLSWALLSPSALWSLPGFAITGIGYSSIIPLVFGAGGRIPSVPSSTGVALVGGAGYLGFIVGPPVIGLLSTATSLRVALFFVVALSLVAAALAGSVRPTDQEVTIL